MTKTIAAIRKDFPTLHIQVHNKPLVYLDNGATAQKPQHVIDAIKSYYENENSNIHRGVHYLSQVGTDRFEQVRNSVQSFINAKYNHEVIFTKGTTDSINLVASSFTEKFVHKGDEIVISGMEHHSNIVPWQLACEKRGAALKVVPIKDDGTLDMDEYEKLLSDKTKLVAIVHVSNALGTINPAKEIIDKAHQKNIPVLLDGAQAVPHQQVDVQALDCDFYCFSAHKMFGPTGVGVLYGKEKWLNEMPPYQGGGDMISEVTFEKTTYNELPHKFEAGTPNIAGVIGLGAAIDYINAIGYDFIEQQEEELLHYATEKLKTIPNIRFYGTAPEKCAVISFLIEGTHPSDVGVLIDKMGVAVRTGHHCTQPIMNRFCIPGTIRASFAFYNTKEEVDVLIASLQKAVSMLL
jgi:cysteine desulfurase / selenocysteine lyase